MPSEWGPVPGELPEKKIKAIPANTSDDGEDENNEATKLGVAESGATEKTNEEAKAGVTEKTNEEKKLGVTDADGEENKEEAEAGGTNDRTVATTTKGVATMAIALTLAPWKTWTMKNEEPDVVQSYSREYVTTVEF
jgi:hypothetical protein